MVDLLLLPGTLCDETLWSHQREHLRDVATVRVCDLATHTTVAATAEALLASAPPRFALAGLSLGGIVALEMVRLAPKRVARLALLNTSARPLAPEQAAEWEQLGVQAIGGAFGGIAETLLPPMLAVAHQGDAQLRNKVISMARSVGAAGFLRQVAMQHSRRDNRALLPSIACPTLVVGGQQDQVCPPERQREMIEQLPNAALVVVERCGHLSPLEQPVAVTALLRSWLATDRYTS